jgi:hypothetical protein
MLGSNWARSKNGFREPSFGGLAQMGAEMLGVVVELPETLVPPLADLGGTRGLGLVVV